jgi:hypothetical protein
MIECWPTASCVVAKVATLELFSLPLPSFVEPSMKLTVPVGGLEPLVVTVAVNDTDFPQVMELAEETRAVWVFAVPAG